MASIRWRLGGAGMVFLVAMTGWAIGQPAKTSGDGKAIEKKKSAVVGLESLKNLPPGTIIVVCDDVKAAHKLKPNLVLLLPKQYQDFLDQIAQLKTEIKAEKATPGECHLKGVVEGDLVRFRADFKFITEKDAEEVLLACKAGQPTEVKLDGRLPLLRLTKDRGLVVHVDKKGEHHVQLDLQVILMPKGDRESERGFELDLPGAAVTSLELDLPEAVKEVAASISTPIRSSARSIPTRLEGQTRRLTQQLGAATGIELSWKGPAPASAVAPLLTAQGLITVRVFEQHVITDAELTLRARGKPIDVWRLHVPPHATVTVKPFGSEERVSAEIENAPGTDDTTRLIRLKEPSMEPLQVAVHVEQKRAEGAIPIGPFAVEGATQQRGDIRVTAPDDARLRLFPRGTVGPRELTPEEQILHFKTAFSYWSVPGPGQAGQPFPPLLEVDAESSRGNIETRVEHDLEKFDQSWKLKTVIHVTPLAAGVDTISVVLPADYRLLPGLTARPNEPAYAVKSDPGGAKVVEIKLEQKQSKTFQVTLEGTYPAIAEPLRQATFELPQPQQTVTRAGVTHQVTIGVQENVELEMPTGRDAAWEVIRNKHNRQTWSSGQLPKRIEIAWQPHRQELLLAGVADIAISGRTVHVVQQLWFALAQAPAEVQIREPEGASDIQVFERGEWKAASPRTMILGKDVSEKRPFRMRYSFPIKTEGPGAPVVFAIPLAVPGREARCDTKLRIACEPGTLAERAGGPWEELPLEATVDEKRLASLVLRGDRPETPPILRLSETPFASLATVGVEKALIRVRVTDQGQQSYHASFAINRIGTRYLDIELPAPPASLNLKVALGGLPISWGPVEDGAPRPAGTVEAARVARVPLGSGPMKPGLLEVSYQIGLAQLPSRNAAWARAVGPLQTWLQPPRLCGQTDSLSVRWLIVLPSDWVPVHEEGASASEQSWGWRGWLLATHPTPSVADLERWLTETEGIAANDEGDAVAYPSLASWRTDLESLKIVHVPHQAWLLGCSLVLLAIGLALYFAQASRVLFWALLLLLGTVTLAAGLLWPGVLSAVFYGCEPGLIALVVVVGVQWLLHQRYRRRVEFLPSFKRVKSGGSPLVAAGGSSRPRGEPSTVDVLPPGRSSQWAKGGGSGSASGTSKPPGS